MPLLHPASQGSTGDPRLLSRRKAIASQAPPSRGWHVASCRPVPPRAFAIHQNGTFGGRLPPHLGNLPGKGSFFRKVLRFSGGPSMPGAVFPEGPSLFRGTFHARGRFPGRSCAFPGDLPCQEPFSRKVLRFSGGPSMPGAVFLEGPAFFRGTFHASARFSGRSCAFPGDLPCQEPFSRKVLRFSGGPSMLGAIFPEGPCPSALSQRYFGTLGTKNARFAPGLHYFGTPGAVRPLIQERQRRSRSTYDVCARSRDGYERPASNNAPGRRAFCLSSPHPARL